MISVSVGHLLLILMTQAHSDPGVFLVETKDDGLAGKLLKKPYGSALKTSRIPKNQRWGSGMFIQDPNFPSRILGSKLSRIQICIKEFKHF
jgi:hypothetical protein